MDRWENQKLGSSKNGAFFAYSRDKNNPDLFNKFQSPQAHLKTTIEESNQNYYSRLSNTLLDSIGQQNKSEVILVNVKDPCK